MVYGLNYDSQNLQHGFQWSGRLKNYQPYCANQEPLYLEVLVKGPSFGGVFGVAIVLVFNFRGDLCFFLCFASCLKGFFEHFCQVLDTTRSLCNLLLQNKAW